MRSHVTGKLKLTIIPVIKDNCWGQKQNKKYVCHLLQRQKFQSVGWLLLFWFSMILASSDDQLNLNRYSIMKDIPHELVNRLFFNVNYSTLVPAPSVECGSGSYRAQLGSRFFPEYKWKKIQLSQHRKQTYIFLAWVPYNKWEKMTMSYKIINFLHLSKTDQERKLKFLLTPILTQLIAQPQTLECLKPAP